MVSSLLGLDYQGHRFLTIWLRNYRHRVLLLLFFPLQKKKLERKKDFLFFCNREGEGYIKEEGEGKSLEHILLQAQEKINYNPLQPQ